MVYRAPSCLDPLCWLLPLGPCLFALALSLLLNSIALFVTAGGGWGVAEEGDQDQDREEGDQVVDVFARLAPSSDCAALQNAKIRG